MPELNAPETVTFMCQGASLSGDLYRPEASAPEGAPAVVACPGWGGTKEGNVGEFVERLVRAGFVALIIDYRGYGASEGERNRLYPLDQVADIRAAAAFLRGQAGVDPARVVALGILTGAAAALQAASEDTGIRAVVAFFAFGSGERWMRSLRRHWEWLDLRRRLDADSIRRSVTGETELLDPNDVILRDPDGVEREAKSRAARPSRRDWRLGLDSVDAIISFAPEDHVHRIAPRASMLIAIEGDTMMPLHEAERLHSVLPDPKRLVVLPLQRHHDIYLRAQMDSVMMSVKSFLMESMA